MMSIVILGDSIVAPNPFEASTLKYCIPIVDELFRKILNLFGTYTTSSIMATLGSIIAPSEYLFKV